MSLGDYLFYSLVGICVVFCVLIFLMVVIKLLMYEPRSKAAMATAGSTDALESAGLTASPSPIDIPLAPGVAGDILLYDTDPRDAAMIMAIVADELDKPLNELRFISIREVKE